MNKPAEPTQADADARELGRLGYAQELRRGLGALTNLALSMSVICILAGGVTSFHLGLCSVGGAAIGLGWPMACLFSLVVALTMGQLASAFPTAGGLYHWAALLGGPGWGWFTAWLNLAGLVTVLAAINVGMYQFLTGAFGVDTDSLSPAAQLGLQSAVVLVAACTQALLNHLGIRLTGALTAFSGYWILLVSIALTASVLIGASRPDPARLLRFENFSGLPADDRMVWPPTHNLAWLFILGLLLPVYTMTGFDASAHAAEETVGAGRHVPRGIVRSVLVSGVFGWVMLGSLVLAAPDLRQAAAAGPGAFFSITGAVLRPALADALYAAIGIAQYLCGLATVTAASRMAYAFARDGGLPFSAAVSHVDPHWRTPTRAIWAVALLSVVFTVYTPAYDTISVVCAVFLYLSYVLPTALGLWAYGRTWTRLGPWHLGACYRPLAVLAVAGGGVLLFVGLLEPTGRAWRTLAGFLALLALVWWAHQRRHFRGPPHS
jgi:amino acid transporter